MPDRHPRANLAKPMPNQYETTSRRIGVALLAGSLAGGLALAAFHYAWGVSPSLKGFLIDFGYGSVASAVMLAHASPGWAYLHRRSYRTWYAAALFGVGTTLAVCLLAFVVITGGTVAATRGAWWPDRSDIPDALVSLSLLVTVGGTMGWVVCEPPIAAKGRSRDPRSANRPSRRPTGVEVEPPSMPVGTPKPQSATVRCPAWASDTESAACVD